MMAQLVLILVWLTVTITIFQVYSWVFHKMNRRALFHPVAWTIATLVLLLLLTKVDYKIYFEGSKFLHLLLGPCTVALAVPLYEQRAKLLRLLKPLLVSLGVGSVVGVLSAVGVAKIFGAGLLTIRSVGAKSVTTPIAMGITEKVGGDVSLVAIIVILTGIFGAMVSVYVLGLLPFKDEEAKGFAIGMSSHGIGTARAFQESVEMGAFSGLAIGLNGLMTALILPILFKVLGL